MDLDVVQVANDLLHLYYPHVSVAGEEGLSTVLTKDMVRSWQLANEKPVVVEIS
jgi:hypothetical protein